jgi:hypothetical protein
MIERCAILISPPVIPYGQASGVSRINPTEFVLLHELAGFFGKRGQKKFF